MLSPILADSWLDRHQNLVVAAVTIVATVVLVWIVDRAIGRYLVRTAQRMSGGDLSPSADTRLRILRRIIDTAIVVLGIAIAGSQIAALSSLAQALVASSALAAAVIGFAARQPVANAVAGLVLASSQPIRVGDFVAFGDDAGVVEDVRLTSTVIRAASGAHLIVPNETFVQSVVRNDSLPGTLIRPEADVWLPHGVSVTAARAAVQGMEEGVTVSVAETSPDGFRLTVAGRPVPPAERGGREAVLRGGALDAIRAAGLQD